MGAVTPETCRVTLQWINICILLHLLDFYSHWITMHGTTSLKKNVVQVCWQLAIRINNMNAPAYKIAKHLVGLFNRHLILNNHYSVKNFTNLKKPDPVWRIPLLCVQWKSSDDGQRNCPKHVDLYFKNEFEKLVHLVALVIIIINIMDWTLWSVPSPELQLLAPTLLRSSNCSPSLWSVLVWFQKDSVLWHSLQVWKPVPSVFIYLV